MQLQRFFLTIFHLPVGSCYHLFWIYWILLYRNNLSYLLSSHYDEDASGKFYYSFIDLFLGLFWVFQLTLVLWNHMYLLFAFPFYIKIVFDHILWLFTFPLTLLEVTLKYLESFRLTYLSFLTMDVRAMIFTCSG